jgi:hypothetical protein
MAVKLQVQHHPSGNYTLTEHQPGKGLPCDLPGDLRHNGDGASFYKAVAKKLAEYSVAGIAFTYHDV